jgi:hypothetical protein
LCVQLVFEVLGVLGRAETTGTLLIHFGSRGYAVHSEKKDLLRLDGVNKLVDSLHHSCPDLLEVIELTNTFMPLRIITVYTIVYNTVQVHVEVIDSGQLIVVGNVLQDHRVSSRQPSEEFGDSHACSK